MVVGEDVQEGGGEAAAWLLATVREMLFGGAAADADLGQSRGISPHLGTVGCLEAPATRGRAALRPSSISV